jgi:site-specific recombinase XerD
MTALRKRMLEDMKIRNLALNTQDSYLRQVSQFARHFGRSPELLGQEEIRSYQIYLMQEKKLDSGSVTIAVSALRFLYKVTLRREWKLDDVIPTPKTPKKLPVVLSPEEVLEFLGCVRLNNHRTILTCCYAAGLRISEAIALQAAHIDSQRMVIRVEQGKGRKDRYVMLSPKLLEILRQWWRQERPQLWLFPGGIPGRHITRGGWKTPAKKHTNSVAFPNPLPHTR